MNKQPISATLSRSPAWRKIMNFYRYLKPGLWAMRLPLVGRWLQRAFIKENQDANWFIPVGEAIPVGTQMILPGSLVEGLLRQAEGIFAMSACPCRTAFHYSNHPWTIGCLHLGGAARRIPSEVGRLLTLEEGLAHLQQALASGLIPTILYIPSEAEIFQVDRHKMLSICFCCECCCDVRLMLRDGPDRYWDLYNHRMPGVNVVVSADCVLCGECVRACYGGERVIHMGSERAEIH
jgi:UDP-glucose 4-epimerase